MKYLQSISPEKGAEQWHHFIQNHASLSLLSFNPSLLDFYGNYFGWKPYYFLIYDGERLTGIFPLVDTGRKFVSLPHFSYGGMIWADKQQLNTPEVIQTLVRLVREEKPETGFLKFQINAQNSLKEAANLSSEKIFIRSLWDFEGAVKSNKVSSLLQLPGSNAELLKMLSSGLRRKLRKTMENGLETKQGGLELLDDFYGLYARNMHRLGSPVYSKSFFKSLFENYKDGEIRIFLIRLNDQTVGAAFLMSYFGFFENTWFSTDKSHQKLFISDLLHWEMIQYAIANKAAVYSMGRSTQDGNVHRYKKHWPLVDKPLFHFDTDNGLQLKNQTWLAGLWKITPYSLTLRLGPGLVKHIY
jgi:hypothetical protein